MFLASWCPYTGATHLVCVHELPQPPFALMLDESEHCVPHRLPYVSPLLPLHLTPERLCVHGVI